MIGSFVITAVQNGSREISTTRSALSLTSRLLARIVLLDLAVFFTWGSDLSGMGHFLADILNGGDRAF